VSGGGSLCLYIKAKNLPSTSNFGVIDPYCIVYAQDSQKKWVEVGETYTKPNDKDASWNPIILTLESQAGQSLKFEVMDNNGNKKHELVGSTEAVSLATLLSGGTKTMKLMGKDCTELTTLEVIMA